MDAAKGGNAPKPETPADQRFFPVPVDSLDFQTLPMDLYLRYEGAGPTLYRNEGLQFTRDDLARLVEQGVKFLLIPASQHAAYRKTVTDRLSRSFKDPEKAAIERGRIVRASCAKIIEDVLLFAGQGEPVEAVAEVSKTFTAWSKEDPAAFSYLLDMSAHDFGTAAHMVNVGVGCGLLARELSPGDDALFQTMVQGGMLHDVGKRGIPEALLNKEGKLDANEWKIVSAHPARGFEELSKNPTISKPVLSMVRDHHEHLSGAGYPQGLKADQISVPARICAVIDVFDAITAARPYRGPTPPTETLKIMNTGRGSQFDPKVFDAFSAVVGRMLEADPSRAPASSPDAPARLLADLLPSGAALVAAAAGAPERGGTIWRENRRRHDRLPCNLVAQAIFHHQGKANNVRPGEAFNLRVVDVSRAGVQVVTPWPMSIGDVLTIDISPKEGVRLKRQVRVVRVRKHPPAEWSAGLEFFEADGRKEAA
jgi:HD-GYP domain-containing protein (c-di-GMP phosphodiesterase class II)